MRGRKLALVGVIAIGAGFFVYYLYQALWFIQYPNSIDYGEGYVMNYIRLWASGQWKWDVTMPPYLTMPYGVGYTFIVLPFAKLFGSTLEVGRAIGFASALVTCLFVYLIVKQLTGKTNYAVIAALLPATQPIFRDWSVMARVDMVSVMFEVIGLYILIMRSDYPQYIGYLAIIPFALATMVKLSAIAAIVAVLIVIVTQRWRVAITYSVVFLVVLASMIIPLQIWSHGDLLRDMIQYQQTTGFTYLPRVNYMLQMFAFPLMPLLILALLYARICCKKRDFNIMAVFMAVALAANALETLRPGSASNYYLESIIAVSICAALGLRQAVAYWHRREISVGALAVGAIAVLMFGMYAPRHNADWPNAQFTKDVATVQSIIADSRKPLITENSAIALNTGHELYIENFVFTNMTRLGYWNETPYIKAYNSKAFDYVLLRTPLADKLEASRHGIEDELFTDSAMQAIDRSYSLVWQTESRQFPYAMYLYKANGGTR